MKRLLLLTLILILNLSLFAQKKPAAPTLPDLAALKKMTPAQLQAYQAAMQKSLGQQAKAMGKQSGIKVNDMALPGFELAMPPKDFKRLALIPKNPPTLIQLADGLRQSKKALESVTPKPVLEAVNKQVQSGTPAQLQSASVGAFYSDKPAEALLLSMSSALQNQQEPTAWNNLAAMFNMAGLEQKAIPILMHQLQQHPGNAMLLNNMGQAYLGLGDAASAEDYLTKCLAVDPLNPEAARSMGLLRYFQKRYDEGVKYFEKELEISHRRSTLALMKRKGQPANLYKLRMRRPDVPRKNHFEEISLAKFAVPDFPGSCDEAPQVQAAAKGFLQSATAELLFWQTAATEKTEADRNIERYQTVNVYADLVEELLDGLHSSFPAENLTLFTEGDLNLLAQKTEDYYRKVAEIKYPDPPSHMTEESREAYAKVCCEIRKAVDQPYMLSYNATVRNRISIVQARWKDYINGLISIVRYNPSPGNKSMVYGMVGQYFNFLITAWQSAVFIGGCKPGLTLEEALTIVESSRKIDFSCPSWLNINIGLGVASLSANCTSYSISGGEAIQFAYEKNFETGTSTIAGGVGVSANFGVFGASAGHMLYLTYDKNNEFVDLGIRGGANAGVTLATEALVTNEIGQLSREIGGVGGGYTLGINSGFRGSIESTGILSEFIKLETPQ